jgi:membrane associated rhomboid family serine protease
MPARSGLTSALGLAVSASPEAEQNSFSWLVLAGIVLLYAALIATWLWLARRWGLAGPGAPKRSALGRSEYLARRSLRALLAFDFLVIIPIGLPAVVAILYMAVTHPRDFDPAMVWAAVGFLAFILAVPALRRSIRRMEQQRHAGQVAQPEPLPNTSGLVELDKHLRAKAWGTRGAAGLIVCVSVAAWVVPDHRLAAVLLKDNNAILSGQLWRLLTVALVHGSLMHLLFNVSVLLSVGTLLERLAGIRQLLVVLVVGTLASSVCSVAFLPRPSVGASGGVLAVAAAVVAFGLRHRALFPPAARSRLFRASVELVALNALLTFVLPNVDWAAHVGGLLAGAALGWIAKPAQDTLVSLAASPHQPQALTPGGWPPPPAVSG